VKKIILCSHAQDRISERIIDKYEIIEVVKNPDITTPTKHKRRKRLMKNLNNKTIDVIIEERDNIILVVTCAVLNKGV
jgi:hypothetical protein